MPKRKKRKTPITFSTSRVIPLPAILSFIIIIIVVGIVLFLTSQLKPTVESTKTDLKRIPKEIKKSFTKGASATLRVPILLYHYVEYVQDKKDITRQSLDINPNIVGEQIKTLQDAGYTFMTASELADILDGSAFLPPKPILLTFDDGHWDLYTDVLPILEKYHAKATAYIIPGFVGGSDFLTQDQLKKIIQSGLIEIGAHTVHHIALAGKLLPVVQYEVSQSKKMLEDTYHLHVVSFAYPAGSFDQQAINVVQKAGFRTAVSTIPGIAQNQTNKFFLYRIRPGQRTGQELLNFLAQNTFQPW